MSTSGGSGRRADAVRNRQLALQAATALLDEPGIPLIVDAIATKAGLGAGTVVRAFGGKDALLDAAVSGLLEPVVQRARALLEETSPEQALRTFLTELIAFQSAHHAISDQLGGLNVPATAALRAELARAVQEMITGARRDGKIRTDIDPTVTTTLIAEATSAIARTRPAPQELASACITVLMDGLRPQPPAQESGPASRSAHAQPFGAPPPAGPASPAKGRQTEPAQEPAELRAADVVAVKSLDPVDAQVRGLSGAEAASPRMAREYPAWGVRGIVHPRPLRMYTGVPGVGTSVWKNAEMCIGIRTQPWEAGRSGTSVSPWIAKMVPMKNTGLYISPSGTVTRPGMNERVVKSPVGVTALPQPFGEQK